MTALWTVCSSNSFPKKWQTSSKVRQWCLSALIRQLRLGIGGGNAVHHVKHGRTCSPCMKTGTEAPIPCTQPLARCQPCTELPCNAAGVAVPPEATYDDFVRISKEIMRGRNPEQQREVVKNVLRSLLPEEAPPAFRCHLCRWHL